MKKFNITDMTKEIISREMAIKELNDWYDELQVPEDMRLDVDMDEYEDDAVEGLDQDDDYLKEKAERLKKREKDDIMRERFIRSIMNGSLILNENKELEYTLKYPVEKKDSGEVVLSKLKFKKRYHQFELETQMKGIKPEEFMPMTRAYIATLTGVSKSILGRMLNRDMEVAQAIYTLFTRGEA